MALFFCGLALFFALQPDSAIISESNPDILGYMTKYISQIEVVPVNDLQSAGKHGHKINKNNNKVQEYLYVVFFMANSWHIGNTTSQNPIQVKRCFNCFGAFGILIEPKNTMIGYRHV